MKTALIGYTGFVGSNLAREQKFDGLYNSANIGSIGQEEYDLVVCAAPSAVKWKANQEPEQDLKIITSLQNDLQQVRTKQFILISTVDVYKVPSGVNEETVPDLVDLHPYGKHRLLLENFVANQFPQHLIVRLPALFGQGLKKNFIFDLLNNNALDFTHKDSKFQFYPLKYLWKDIQIALKHNLKLLDITSVPISAAEIASECFGTEFKNVTANAPANYDVRSVHADLFGGKDGYLYSQAQVIAEIKAFISDYKH